MVGRYAPLGFQKSLMQQQLPDGSTRPLGTKHAPEERRACSAAVRVRFAQSTY